MSFDPEWIKEGKKQKSKWLVVVCDTFDHDDYPCFYDNDADMRKRVKSPGDMQTIMEVFELKKYRRAPKSTFLRRIRDDHTYEGDKNVRE